MTTTTKAFQTLAFVATLALPLTACESVDNAMLDMKQRISAIEMPKITGKEETTLQEEEAPVAFAAATQDAAPVPETLASAAVTEDCPPVTIVQDLAALHQFTNPQRPTPDSRISSVLLKDLTTSCSRNDNNMVVDIDLTFEGKLGPHASRLESESPSFAYPYFVAIATTDGTIAAKEVFATTITYHPEAETTFDYENMRQIIPLNGAYDTDYEFLVGFQLTEGELAYNRALSEGAAISDHVAEHFITPSVVAEPKAPKAVAAVPETKPPVPAVAQAPQPEPEPEPELQPEPAPAPVTAPVTTSVAPAPVTPVSPAPAAPPADAVDLTAPVVSEPVIIQQEEAPAEEDEILEENAIIDTDNIADPVDELQPPNRPPATMTIQ